MLSSTSVLAQINLPRNMYGSVGLIDMPSARMAPDGDLSVGAAFTENIQHYNLGFQLLPWLETDFRYSGLQHFDPLYPVYYDRSLALKARLWQEGEIVPAVAIGINDVVGTGAYGGEYLVASKQFGSVDATLGLGWGRMGSTALFRNPLSLLSLSFNNRPDAFGVNSTPGATNVNALFHGHDVGLFGGLAWATPVEGLTLIGEYSSDAYTLESQRGTFQPRDQVNLGASYALTDDITLGANWLYGRSAAASINFELDPVHDPFPQKLGAPPPEPRLRTPEEQQAALEALTEARRGTALAALRPRAFLASAEMVDGLWQSQATRDIRLDGHVISLVMDNGNPHAACRNAAGFIGQYSSTITSVRVIQGGRTIECPVVAMPALAVLNASYPTDMGAVALSDVAVSTPLLIDAGGRSVAGDRAIIAKIRASAAKQSILISAITLGHSDVTVYYSNYHYFSEIDAVQRLSQLLMGEAPPEIEKFRLIAMATGEPSREFDVLRAPAERSISQEGAFNFRDDVQSQPAPMQNPDLWSQTRGNYPNVTWSVFPQFRQEFFDPTNPFGVQFLAAATGTVTVFPGLMLQGEAETSLFDTFNTARPSDSLLPHVRTDFLEYFTKGKNGIANLEADYRFRLSPTVFAMARAGYLESMFAGAGGEILWRPEGQRWALGADGFEVQQRNFDRLFGLQQYRVFTGHVTLYWSSPFYDLDFMLRAGQYLAGDRGLTFQMTRRFSTGVEVGAFFTKTNVSSAQFGEGSFDKGFILRIPIGWVAPISTQSEVDMDIRPVQRDGGQALLGDARLYYETERMSEAELERLEGN